MKWTVAPDFRLDGEFPRLLTRQVFPLSPLVPPSSLLASQQPVPRLTPETVDVQEQELHKSCALVQWEERSKKKIC